MLLDGYIAAKVSSETVGVRIGGTPNYLTQQEGYKVPVFD
jgi:hypothetical protein